MPCYHHYKCTSNWLRHLKKKITLRFSTLSHKPLNKQYHQQHNFLFSFKRGRKPQVEHEKMLNSLIYTLNIETRWALDPRLNSIRLSRIQNVVHKSTVNNILIMTVNLLVQLNARLGSNFWHPVNFWGAYGNQFKASTHQIKYQDQHAKCNQIQSKICHWTCYSFDRKNA